MARLSLAQQLAQLDDAAPVDFDPEALEAYGGDDKDVVGEVSGASKAHYVDVGPSELRKLQDSVSDPKYDGVRTTRKDLQKLEFEDGSDLESEDEYGEFPILHRASSGEESGEPKDSDDDDDDDAEMEEDEEEVNEDTNTEGSQGRQSPATKPSKRPLPDSSDDSTSALKQAREADKKKGQAVQKQIALWDTLLDSRIQVQKAVAAANKLPAPNFIPSYMEDPDCAAALLKFSQEALAFAEALTSLQEKLLATNEDLQAPPRKKRRVGDEQSSLSNIVQDLTSACETSASLEHMYHPRLVQTLSKWSAKIQAVAPSVLLPSNKGAFAKGKQQLKSAVQLIDDTLQDSQGLVARTRLRRTPGARVKPASAADVDGNSAEDIEIFDDTDFYQKMLRDVIDARGGDGKDADWIATQKQKKAKKEVDTKASKGRKIRYHVHEKLQNFMMPIPNDGGWHEEQIDELFSSLLGKGFDGAVVDFNGEGTRPEQPVIHDGFRVFG